MVPSRLSGTKDEAAEEVEARLGVWSMDTAMVVGEEDEEQLSVSQLCDSAPCLSIDDDEGEFAQEGILECGSRRARVVKLCRCVGWRRGGVCARFCVRVAMSHSVPERAGIGCGAGAAVSGRRAGRWCLKHCNGGDGGGGGPGARRDDGVVGDGVPGGE